MKHVKQNILIASAAIAFAGLAGAQAGTVPGAATRTDAAQTGAAMQGSGSESHGVRAWLPGGAAWSNRTGTVTPYEGPTTYGQQQYSGLVPPFKTGITPNPDPYGQCAASSGSQTQWESCMRQHNDATWNAGGVQDDHGA